MTLHVSVQVFHLGDHFVFSLHLYLVGLLLLSNLRHFHFNELKYVVLVFDLIPQLLCLVLQCIVILADVLIIIFSLVEPYL